MEQHDDGDNDYQHHDPEGVAKHAEAAAEGVAEAAESGEPREKRKREFTEVPVIHKFVNICD